MAIARKSTTNSKTDETKSFHLCFKWLYAVMFYTGCLCFRQRGGALKLTTADMIYTNFIRITLVLGFIGGIALKFSDEKRKEAMLGHLSPILKFVLIFECLISTVTYIVVAIMMDIRKHDHMRLFNRIQQLDLSMAGEFLSICWNYHKSVKKYTPLSISVTIFYYTVSLIYLYNLTNCACDRLTTLIIALSYASITIAPGSCTFLHVGAMDMLRIRFRLIRKMMEHNFRAFDEHYKSEEDLHYRVTRLIKYCRSYTEVIQDMNNVFGFTILASVFYDFGLLTNMSFLLCHKASESRASITEYIFILLFMAPRLYKLIMTPAYGYVVNKEKNNCIHIITTYINYFPSCASSVREQDTLKSFLHWKMHHCYDLTIGKMMRCNLIVLYMAFNGIANYVIILIQLQFQQNNIANRLKNHEMLHDVELINRKMPIIY